ncbi:hypothetical protein [Neorhizobium tomejilense]|uniref:hypothetical protein n=1 Tax=Neorhizobium tomejilense TaxID=2093828 RepID=UPI000CFA433E|nr:hypothetical protein [Neorhizobium tomejilense]
MTNGSKQLSKTSIETLSAIYKYRHQRRSGRAWLVGNRRVSVATVSGLERKAFLKEVAFNGTPTLVLTDEGKRLVVGR